MARKHSSADQLVISSTPGALKLLKRNWRLLPASTPSLPVVNRLLRLVPEAGRKSPVIGTPLPPAASPDAAHSSFVCGSFWGASSVKHRSATLVADPFAPWMFLNSSNQLLRPGDLTDSCIA